MQLLQGAIGYSGTVAAERPFPKVTLQSWGFPGIGRVEFSVLANL